jgi:hypothetical protein
MGQKSDGISRREWNTPEREPWNALIKEALQGVDRHNVRYFETGDARHLHFAAHLRSYVSELKDLLMELESTER